jgi:predicted ATP-binding protein involved in virulence
VLIDEIDTYLHPEWQRTILNVLVNEFPNTQFVVTTHSADILSNIDTRKDKDYFVYRLERSQDGMTCVELDPKAGYNPFGAEINDIYTNIFGKDERASAEVIEQIKQLQACIKAKQFEQADAIVTELKSMIDPSDAELMRLMGILDTRKMLAQ